MTQDELLDILRAHEWRDIEFKEAQTEVPRSAYETVSAFANTDGGHLVFGVKKDGTSFEVVGVLDVDKVQGDFLTALRQVEKISVILDIEENLHQHGEKHILVFYVPEVHRSRKPVYLNGDIRRSFVRKGGCDVRCSEEERNRFLVDAAAERYDGLPVDLDPNNAFDGESIRWYRGVYEAKPGNRSHAALTDLQFLAEMGLLVECDRQQMPSRASILLFGTNAAFRQALPRPVVDCQRFARPIAEADMGDRWDDRVVMDENLIRVWQQLVAWYEKLADRPFRVDPTTLQRDDMPPDYRAYREAMANLIIHQDYSDHSRKAEIRHYADQTVFWNPGDAFDVGTDLLEPGVKEVRNPRIVTSFRRIGLSENAGWGLRDVFRNWQQMGHVPPEIRNDKGRKAFELSLRKEELLSERQILFHATLGVRLSDAQARAFAFACRESEVTVSQLKAILGLPGVEVVALTDSLVTQVLFKPVEPGKRYALADHLRARFDEIDQPGDQVDRRPENLVTAQVHAKPTDLSTAQVARSSQDLSTGQVKPLESLTDSQWRIVLFCDVPRKLTEIMAHLGVVNRGYFKANHIEPLLKGGVLAMTNPEKPRSSNQRYVITEAGVRLKVARMARDSEKGEETHGKA